MAGSNPQPSSFESISRKLHEPLLPPLLAVISGILFVHFLSPSWQIALLAATLTFGLWYFARTRNLPRATLLAGNAAMFWLAVASASYATELPPPYLDAEPRELITVTGCIDSLPQRSEERLSFVLQAAPGARLRVSYYLKPNETPPDWHYGYQLQIPVRVKRIHNAGNPGNFDAERYFAHRQIYWTASIAHGYPVVQAPNACGNPVQAAIYSTRAFLLDRIQKITAGDTYLNAMLAALLLGDNTRLEDSFTENYRRTGTYHAIVISGIHITVLAGAIFALLRLCGIRTIPAYTTCACIAIAYALVCDLSAPVVRAAGGYLLFLGSKVFNRQGRTLNLLAAVAIVYLLCDTQQLFEASFQLSFLAVLALATLADPLLRVTTADWAHAFHSLAHPQFAPRSSQVAARRLELMLLAETIETTTALPRKYATLLIRIIGTSVIWGIDVILTSAVVLIGLCLPMILFFHRLTLSSLTANLPVVFLLSLAVPLGFLAIATGPILVPILKWLLLTSRDVVDWHLTWDTAVRIPDPPAWLLLAFPASLIATAFTARKHPRFTPIPLGLTIGLFLFLIFHPYATPPQLHPNQLELTAMDVGQGDSLFLATPQGHLAVVDGGGSRFSRLDPGESNVSAYLWSRRIATVDTLIASHGDLDHLGGLLSINDNFHPREVWVSSQISGPLWERFKTHSTQSRIRYLSAGDQLQLGELQVRVLWPPKDEPMNKSNLTSLVLLLTHGTKHFLFTGDIDQSVEARLLEDPALPRLDVLKVAHHGSRFSTTQSFLDHTRPAIAISSAGFENGFNHPHPTVSDRLSTNHVLHFRTDRMGQITLLSDGHKLTADPYIYRNPKTLGWIPLTQALE